MGALSYEAVLWSFFFSSFSWLIEGCISLQLLEFSQYKPCLIINSLPLSLHLFVLCLLCVRHFLKSSGIFVFNN